ncbi:HPr kinase/phosphatase C-terminal domain-containing protein [Altererythrobacter sp. ZODW24]|uniref:HPr kinase/phosphorylase n=1 Tax=Altererythrobacter sp. ZODW24 TaxID=2185142 RepID=UPI001F0775C0|nr:HPr kinase/phosphatase C-terminal domain-containing protein [Altererythrobacter sp. ZODW24]
MTGPIAYQGTCVSVGGQGILIVGPPGSGKSSLALMLIDRGAQLVGDDGVMLTAEGGLLHAAPHPNTARLFEIRNVGLVAMRATDAQVCLALQLTDGAPRFTDEADTLELQGLEIPAIKFRTGDAAAAIRAEWALSQYGLAANTQPPSH